MLHFQKSAGAFILSLILLLSFSGCARTKGLPFDQSTKIEVSDKNGNTSKVNTSETENNLENSTNSSISAPKKESSPTQSEAKKIVEEAIQRGEVCNWLYQGSFAVIEDADVIDGFLPIDYSIQRDTFNVNLFQSLNDIKTFFDNTFVEDTAYLLWETIKERKIYNEINGNLYVGAIGGGVPFTTLTYETNTMKFIKIDIEKIIVHMDTSCNGEPDESRELTIENYDGKWYLNDTFVEFV